ncbi:MAG: PilN domain-containing protein [Phascolarctobacterium sp.]
MEEQEKTMKVLRRLRCHWQHEGRKKKQLVLLQVGQSTIQSSCWQADCCLWQKEKTLEVPWQEGCDAWWQELKEALQDTFIWARVPEMVDTIVLLEEELVLSTQLELPKLKEKELAQAVAWEAEQLVPEESESHNTAFAVAEADANKVQIQLWAWPREQVERACRLAMGLHLRLQGILVGISKEKVQWAWYKGYSMKNWSLQDGSSSWLLQAERLAQSNFPRHFLSLCVVLSLGLYVVAEGACFMAKRSLDAGAQELAQYAVWEERLQQSQRLEGTLAKYRQLDKKVREQATHMSSSVQRLGQSVSVGCWLELLRGDARSRQWQLEGASYQPESVNRFVDNLQQDPKLGQVQLQNSQQQGDKLSFSLLVKEK